MTNNDDLVEVPWHDGTTRLVEKGCYVLTESGYVYKPVDANTYIHQGEEYSYRHSSIRGKQVLFPSKIEPSVKIVLPTKSGSLIKIYILETPVYAMVTNNGFWSSSYGYSYNEEQLLSYIGNSPVEVIFDAAKP